MKRRTLLKAAGLGAGSLFLPSLLPRGVKAAAAATRPRLVMSIGYHGVHHPRWEMLRGQSRNQRFNYGLADIAESEFSDTLRPLWRHRSKMTVIDGIDVTSAQGCPGNGHSVGITTSLTGAQNRDGGGGDFGTPQSASIDQIIATALKEQEPSLGDLLSLQFAVGGGCSGDGCVGEGGRVSINADGNYLPVTRSPRAVYDRMLGSFDGGAPPPPIEVAQADVLASVGSLYESVKGRLSAADRIRLEQHRDMVRDVEMRYRSAGTITCEAPNPPFATNQASDFEYEQAIDGFWDMTAVALACGISRTVSLGWTDLGSVLPTQGTTVHLHAHGHAGGGADADVLTSLGARYLTHIAELADRLDQIPDENGTLLDNTIIIHITDIGEGNHGMGRWPITIVGGGNFINAGRYYNDPGTPNNKVWVAIANAMGVDIDTVGLANHNGINLQGPMQGLVR